MGLLSAYKEQKRRRLVAERYLAEVLLPSPRDAVEWFERQGVVSTRAVAALRTAQQALALVVAERDALDDQTLSDVSHALSARRMHESGAARDAAADSWELRWRAYAEALASRGRSEAPLLRLARVCLKESGIAEPSGEQLAYVEAELLRIRQCANRALQDAYGAVSLPEDRLPSELFRERSGHG